MTEIIMLAPAERERFADWLQQEAESTALIVEQLDKTPHAATVGKRMKAEATACAIIALKLRQIEDMTISD